jgi:CheY-like chemotaxis protein
VLQVRDNGHGVAKHLAPYLFTPFFTTKAPGEGTGLGLSLSYGLVKAHGGDLTYEPPAEGGAEFRITLPLYETDVPGVFPTHTNGKSTRRILVVDEDPAVHRLVSALFAPDGHAVESVRSGDQALLLAQQGEYDMIIADVGIAAGSAEPFTHLLLHTCPQARDRLVLAIPGEDELATPFTEVPVRKVRKPFNPRDLRTLANEMLQ